MADYHTVYTGQEGETTEWEDLQRKHGNLPPKEPAWKPEAYAPNADDDGAPAKKDEAWVDAKREDELSDLEDELADDRFLEQYRCVGVLCAGEGGGQRAAAARWPPPLPRTPAAVVAPPSHSSTSTNEKTLKGSAASPSCATPPRGRALAPSTRSLATSLSPPSLRPAASTGSSASSTRTATPAARCCVFFLCVWVWVCVLREREGEDDDVERVSPA